MVGYSSYLMLLLASLWASLKCQAPRGSSEPKFETVNGEVELADARFALDLLGKSELCELDCVFSPFSIKNSLMMLALGLRKNGQTERELMQALHLESVETGLAHEAHSELLEKILSSMSDAIQISIASNIILDQRLQLKPSFERDVKGIYFTDIETTDFTRPGKAADQINDWIAENTNDQIQQLVKADSLSARTALVLVNAIFFQGIWRTKFDSRDTIPNSNFYVGSRASEIATVDMMHVKDKFCFDLQRGNGLKFDVLELPYGEGDIVMTILKPYAPLKSALAALQENDLLNTLLDLPQCGEVDVYLPKFSIKQKSDLQTVLKSLNVERLFLARTAQLSEVLEVTSISAEPLFVNEALHEAKIEVDEKGTTAAAASVVSVMFESALSMVPVFKVDQPFFFILYHKPTKTILFMGQVVNPNMEE